MLGKGRNLHHLLAEGALDEGRAFAPEMHVEVRLEGKNFILLAAEIASHSLRLFPGRTRRVPHWKPQELPQQRLA